MGSEPESAGLPPFPQRARKGWGTRSCVNTQLENAVTQRRRKRNGRLISISRRAAHFAFAPLILFWQLRYIPAAAEGANEANAGDKLPGLEVDGGALIINQRGLGRKHLKIAGDTP